MDNTQLEIISKIFDGLTTDSSLEEIEKQLVINQKYDKSLIAKTYSWIYDKLLSNTIKMKENPEPNASMRIFNEDELELLGKENYNRLLKLFNAKILTNEDIDMIMDQLFVFHNYEISERDMSILLLSTLFDIDRLAPPGSRMLLYLNDKIN
jgi:uncharacterized protein Smg (DUF494 family)